MLRSAIATACMAGVSVVSCGPVTQLEPAWMRAGVVLDIGTEGAFDDRGLESPTVVRESDGQLVMWYRGRTFSNDQQRILRAVSRGAFPISRSSV